MTTSSLTSGMTTSIQPDLDLGALPALPRDDEGPVFNAPWEAQAFAITLSLHAAGIFTGANGQMLSPPSYLRQPRKENPTTAVTTTSTGLPL